MRQDVDNPEQRKEEQGLLKELFDFEGLVSRRTASYGRVHFCERPCLVRCLYVVGGSLRGQSRHQSQHRFLQEVNFKL